MIKTSFKTQAIMMMTEKNLDLTSEIVRLQKFEQYGNASATNKRKPSKAEELMADLESACRRTLETTSENELSSLVEQDQQLAAQARTQMMRDPCRNTVQDFAARPARNHDRDERLKKMQGPAESAGALAEKLTYFTFYELLYIEDSASLEEIHAAYVKRVCDIRSRFRCGSITQEWRLTEFIKILHEAHTVLTSQKLRAAYDARLSNGEWAESFKNLIGETSDFRETTRFHGGTAEEVSLTGLLLCAGFLSEGELALHQGQLEGPELVQKLADEALITFEELAAVMLGKALIDRCLLSVAQFVQAVSEMRNHSARFIDAIINEGWLSTSELQVIGVDCKALKN